MSDVFKIKPTTSQEFTGNGSGTTCILDNIVEEIKQVIVNGVENTTYTFDGNVVTVHAAEGSKIEITYTYWTSIPTVKGEDGISAYEYAIRGGYTGTEEAFYTAIASVSSKQATINVNGVLKGNGSGSVVKAVAGADYVIPTGNVATATALETGRKIQTNLASTSTATFDGKEDVAPGVTGVLSTANGGTGNSSVDTTPTINSTKMVTSGGIYNAIKDKADAVHTQSANTISAGTLGGSVVANAGAVSSLNTAQVRNISAGTVDLVAGTSRLAAGDIYIVYEA